MTNMLKTSGLVAVSGLLIAIATLASTAQAKTASGICQSASAKGAISCCERYIKTRAGMRWEGGGGSCRARAMKCIHDGPANYCYYPQHGNNLMLDKETHDHAPSNPGHNTAGKP